MSVSPVSYDKNLIFRLIPDMNYIYNNPYAKINYVGNLTIVSNVIKCNYAGGSSGILFKSSNKTLIKQATVRLIMKVNSIISTGDYLFAGGSNYVQMTNANNLIYSANGGNVYVNGVLNNGANNVIFGSFAEYIITFTNSNRWSTLSSLFCGTNKFGNSDVDVKLVEIYKGNLSVDEVSNLYQGKRYYDIKNDNSLVFDMNAKSGYLQEYTGKSLGTPVGISIINYKKTYAIKFNDITGAIGTNYTVTGNITLSLWINLNKISNVPRPIWSGGFILLFNNNRTIKVYSDGSNSATSGTLITTGLQHIMVTRTSAGITNIYVNGILSGSANQSSGTPTNSTIAFSASGARMSGLILSCKFWSRIFSSNEISEIYSSEKTFYE